MSEAVLNDKTNKFDYSVAQVRDLQCNTRVIPGDKKDRRSVTRTVVDTITVGGKQLKPSKRFWTSIQCRFGFSPNIFRYFTHEEVFNRISQKTPNDHVRLCIERDPVQDSSGTLLAVTNPSAPSIQYSRLTDLLTKYGAKDAKYADGIIRSTHQPRVSSPFKIAGDEFVNQFVLDTPVDGFGRPNIYLSILRLICTNGAVGYGKAFRSEIGTGKTDDELCFALARAIDGFNNEEGYAAMRDRFTAASKSWASVAEAHRLYKLLTNCIGKGMLTKVGRENTPDGQVVDTAMPTLHGFHKMTGDINEIYGIANLDTVSHKRQRTLPCDCKVYDLLNFATEVASHHSTEGGGRKLQAFIGDMIIGEYDLEGTADRFSDYRDFFISDAAATETVQALRAREGYRG